MRAALQLAARGGTASSIARHLEIPRSTVRDWLAGRPPTSASDRLEGRRRCPAWNAALHAFADLPASYVYPLGFYLGDGDIGAHARDGRSCGYGTGRVSKRHVFVFFSNRLGCLGSIAVSMVLTVLLLLVLGVLDL